MICPLCNGPTKRLFAKHGYWICDCQVCHHRCAEIPSTEEHVARVYDDHYFHGGGAGYSNYVQEGAMLTAHGRRYAAVLARYMTPGMVLDVGAAAGFILQGLIESGWRGEGIEPNAQMAAYARAQLQVLVHVGSFEQFQPDTTYDLVTMIQVIAHFLDPRHAFQKARALLRPGGYLLIETWNRASWTARCFGRHWHEYSPPSVLHWFTPAGLGHLAAQCAFREVARGRPQKWLDGAHAKSLLWHILQGLVLGAWDIGRSRLSRIVLPFRIQQKTCFGCCFSSRPTSIVSRQPQGDRHRARCPRHAPASLSLRMCATGTKDVSMSTAFSSECAYHLV